jgi:hypothetical protein
MKKILVLVLLAAAGKAALCCTCVRLKEFSIETEFDERAVIFNGTLVQIDTVPVNRDSLRNYSIDEIWYTFLVSEYFKGKTIHDTIRIRSGIRDADDCKFVFKAGESYVVYADHPLNKKLEPDPSILETSVCTHTGEATEKKIFEAKTQSRYR